MLTDAEKNALAMNVARAAWTWIKLGRECQRGFREMGVSVVIRKGLWSRKEQALRDLEAAVQEMEDRARGL